MTVVGPAASSRRPALMAWMKADAPGPGRNDGGEGSGLFGPTPGGGDHFKWQSWDEMASRPVPAASNHVSNRDVVRANGTVAVTRTGRLQRSADPRRGTVTRSARTRGQKLSSNPDRIGANTLDARYFQGQIDEVRAYSAY